VIDMELEEYLSVPYLLVMEPVEKPDGDWVRHAEYPELPGVEAEAFSPIDALNQVEERKLNFIQSHLARGESIPVPRPPLHGHHAGFADQRAA
jgi:hypothetical protein